MSIRNQFGKSKLFFLRFGASLFAVGSPLQTYAITGGAESRVIVTEQVEIQDFESKEISTKIDNVAILPKQTDDAERGRIFVKGIRIEGSELLDKRELLAVLSSYENRSVTADDLRFLLEDIGAIYRSHGFLDVTVVLPEQTADKGIINLHVIENKIAKINILGAPGRYTQFLSARAEDIRFQALQTDLIVGLLDRIQYDQNIEVLAAQLIPGNTLGESTLNLRVATRETKGFEIGVDNYRSPETGEDRLSISYNNKNSFGYGDSSLVEAGISQGAKDVFTSYTYPVAKTETRVTSYLSWQDASIVNGETRDAGLSIQQSTLLAGVMATQPIFGRRVPININLGLEWRNGETFLNGVVDGTKCGQCWIVQPGIQWIVPRTDAQWVSQFSTRIGNGGEESFWSINWNNAIQRRLESVYPSVLALRATVQLTDSALPGAEKFAIGGAYSVRGFRQNTRVYDNGSLLSAEYRVRFDRLLKSQYKMTLYPFVDYANGFDNDDGMVGVQHYLGTGIGSHIEIGKSFESQIDWAYGWNKPAKNDQLQDFGFYFRLKYRI